MLPLVLPTTSALATKPHFKNVILANANAQSNGMSSLDTFHLSIHVPLYYLTSSEKPSRKPTSLQIYTLPSRCVRLQA